MSSSVLEKKTNASQSAACFASKSMHHQRFFSPENRVDYHIKTSRMWRHDTLKALFHFEIHCVVTKWVALPMYILYVVLPLS